MIINLDTHQNVIKNSYKKAGENKIFPKTSRKKDLGMTKFIFFMETKSTT